MSISRNHVLDGGGGGGGGGWGRRRRRTSLLDDPLVLIMTPFFIILDRLTNPCDSFLDHPVHCLFLPTSCLGRKPRLDLTFTEDEMETVIGVLILVHEFCLHSHVSDPLPNFWTVMPWCTYTSAVNSLHNCTSAHVHFFLKKNLKKIFFLLILNRKSS